MERSFSKDTLTQKLCFIVTTIALFTAVVLSILSLMEICSTSCAEGHKYQLLGIKFEYVGIPLFTALLISHLLGLRSRIFVLLTGCMLALAIGAELYFLYLQKYVIGSWCPVCLGIAGSLGVAASVYFLQSFINHRIDNSKGMIMNSFKVIFSSTLLMTIGFIVAMLGVTKVDTLEAAQVSLKENIAFGNASSPIEVYIFTDWYCPACEAVEPRLQKLVPNLEKDAKVFFIDANIHDESMNFTPYNLSFMINNKQNYFELRRALQKIASQTKTPTDAQVQEAIKPYKEELKDLSYMDIALGSKMFNKLKKQLGVTSTPMIIVVNLDTKKGKRLSGKSEITEINVLNAIDSLKQTPIP